MATQRDGLTLKIAAGSIAVGVLVLALKYVAYLMTGSIALYSDALESIVNIVAAAAAYVAVLYGGRPADANHPYGHHKAEYISAVAEGVFIVVAAVSIFREAWLGFVAPQPLTLDYAGLGINGAASLVNALWATLLVQHGRKKRSPALVADGRHLFTDVLSSVGVLAGVALAKLTGWAVLDPALAALVALNILWSGWQLVKGSVSGLMDESLPADAMSRLRRIISENADGAIEAHDLKSRQAGQATFVDFHLVVPGTMSVSEAHDICDRIEKALKADMPGTTISIHVEPDDKAKHSGIVVL